MWFLEEVSTKLRHGPIEDNFLIGRIINANLQIRNPIISRRHCVLSCKNNIVTIRDLLSSNGVYVNGIEIAQEEDIKLEENDEVRIGVPTDNTDEMETFYISFKLVRVKNNNLIQSTENTKNEGNKGEILHSMSPVLLQRRKRSASVSKEEEIHIPIKVPALINSNEDNDKDNINSDSKEKNEDTRNEVICAEDNNDNTHSLQIQQDTCTEKNTEKAIVMNEDSDGQDLFRNTKSNNSAMVEHYYDLTLDDEDEVKVEEEILQHLSQIKQETLSTENDIFYISSDDDEENPWLLKLSQQTCRSPPPIKEEVDDEQWWPELSQEFDEEIEQENNCDNTVSPVEPCKTKDNSTLVTNNSELVKNFVEKAKNAVVQLDRLEEVKLNIKIPPVNKPKIIEAPVMAPVSKLKAKNDKKESKRNRTSSCDVKDKLDTIQKKSVENTDYIKKRNKRSEKRKEDREKPKEHIEKPKEHIEKPKEHIEKRKEHTETRKKRLKEIATENLEKRKKSEELKKQEIDYQKKEFTKPKVKLTRMNRNDLFLAEMTKEPEPGTSQLKTPLKNYKIPKKTSSKVIESKREKDKKSDNSKDNKKESTDNDKKHTKENSSHKNQDNDKQEKTLFKDKKYIKDDKANKERTIDIDKKHTKDKVDKDDTENRIAKINESTLEIISSTVKDSYVKNLVINKTNSSKSILKMVGCTSVKKKVAFNLEPQIREIPRANNNARLFGQASTIRRFPLNNKIEPIKFPPMKTIAEQIGPPNIRQMKYTLNADLFPCEDIIWEITSWDADWLIKLQNSSPFVIMNRIVRTYDVYEDYERYYNTLLPLMLLELWYYTKRDYEINDRLKKVFFGEIQNVVHTTENLTKGRRLTKIEFVLLLTQDDDKSINHPVTGNLLIVKIPIKDKNKEHKMIRCFGYVLNTLKQPVNSSRDRFGFELISSVDVPKVALYVTVAVKYNPDISPTKETIQFRRVTKISTQMREFTALQHLPLSPLCPLILNPLHVANSCVDYRLEPLISGHELNNSQMEAVQEVCASCLVPEPKICIIQGPPGTGKSLVIANIVLQLLYGSNRYQNYASRRDVLPRILICAPSNAAVDNLALSLLHFRERIHPREHRLRMIRVGQLQYMHEDVQLISLKCLSNKYKEKKNEMDEITATAQKRRYDDDDLFIEKADVVFSTLGSCFNSQLERLSKNVTKKFRFTCCIIDEASQCIEAATLIPLMLGIDTLVLVGDLNQLSATVLSQDAKNYGHSKSLFERFQNCLKNAGDSEMKLQKINFLTTQYRMHPEIVLFPNSYFYESKIINGPNVLKYRFPLLKYQLFIHEFQQSSTEDNFSEAKLIANMVIAISKLVQNVTIGIITPYQQQKFRITRCLSEYSNRLNDVEIETVDSFQGREKDIIILSCVRTDGIGFLADEQRLNVALTRAKHALYIVGNFQSLQTNVMWCNLRDDAIRRNCVFKVKNIEFPYDEFCKVLEDKKFSKHL